jgi:NAD(P)-dependent dehydrogenase (short-subunit alcohol dehydrogenase family)
MPSRAERWAVVLGASAGVGAAVARAVTHDPGLDVFGVHRGHFPDAADALALDIRAAGRRAVLHVADAGTAEGAAACADRLAATAAPRSVTLMVHALSGASIGHFLATDGDAFHPKQFEKTFNYLAHSFAYWVQELHRRDLLTPGARILGLTNTLHESLLHNSGLIAGAKAALEMYVRQLALELGPLGHRVNLLKFGTVVTPALRTLLGAETIAHIEALHRRLVPAGRICTVDEVGRAVSLLARDEAAWFNGATIDFTGGVTLRLMDVLFRNQ